MGKEGLCYGLYTKVLKELCLWSQCSAGYPNLGSVHLFVLTSWVCAFMNLVGFNLTSNSSQNNPWITLNHSCVPATCGMYHGSQTGVVIVKVGNEELFP